MARKPLTPEQKARKNELARAGYRRRMEDPAFRQMKREQTAEWEAKNPDKKRAKNARYQKGQTFKAMRKKWWERNKEKQNAIRKERYYTQGGKEKARIRVRQFKQRKRVAEKAARLKRISLAKALNEKAKAMAAQVVYGIQRKEAA